MENKEKIVKATTELLLKGAELERKYHLKYSEIKTVFEVAKNYACPV